MPLVPACLYAVSSATLLAVLLAFFRGGLSPSIAGASLSCGLLVAAGTLWKGRHRTVVARPPSGWEWAAIAAFTLARCGCFSGWFSAMATRSKSSRQTISATSRST